MSEAVRQLAREFRISTRPSLLCIRGVDANFPRVEEDSYSNNSWGRSVTDLSLTNRLQVVGNKTRSPFANSSPR